MRTLRQPIGLTACLCLLAVQWSGLHRHSDETGTIGAPEIAASHTDFHHHDHEAEHGGGALAHADDGAGTLHSHEHENEHQHENERLVSVLDLELGGAKLPIGIPFVFMPFVPPTAIRAETAAADAGERLSKHGIRWRPPLRAPPRSV